MKLILKPIPKGVSCYDYFSDRDIFPNNPSFVDGMERAIGTIVTVKSIFGECIAVKELNYSWSPDWFILADNYD